MAGKTSKWQARATLLNTAVGNLSAGICFSLIAPFFPTEAYKKGVTSTLVGIMFGVFEFSTFLSSPIFGAYITQIGSRFLYIAGMFICGGANVIFGFINLIDDGTTYTVMCFAARIAEGVGAGMLFTASYSICSNMFPDNVGAMFGVLETSLGIGMMIGPVVGGFLYEWGGFKAPFLVVGIYMIVAVVVSIFTFPTVNDKSSTRQSFVQTLRYPAIVALSITITMGSLSLGFVSPILEPRIRAIDPDVSAVFIGFTFMAGSLSYAVMTPVAGAIADKTNHGIELMLGGTLVISASLMLLGPASFLGVEPQTWILPIGQASLVVGIACAIVPAFPQLMLVLYEKGYVENFETQGIVSGIFCAAWSLGSSLGPTIGGWLNGQIGFADGCTVTAAAILIGPVLLLPLVVRRWLLRRRRSATPVDAESVALLSDEYKPTKETGRITQNTL